MEERIEFNISPEMRVIVPIVPFTIPVKVYGPASCHACCIAGTMINIRYVFVEYHRIIVETGANMTSTGLPQLVLTLVPAIKLKIFFSPSTRFRMTNFCWIAANIS